MGWGPEIGNCPAFSWEEPHLWPGGEFRASVGMVQALQRLACAKLGVTFTLYSLERELWGGGLEKEGTLQTEPPGKVVGQGLSPCPHVPAHVPMVLDARGKAKSWLGQGERATAVRACLLRYSPREEALERTGQATAQTRGQRD